MSLSDAARQLAEQLKATDRRIVFAESCTAGLVSAALAEVPGVSNWLCGSTVTYREQTKVQWLGVPAESIERYTAVSEDVTEAMARGVLGKTAEATIAVAVTGHLGPGAPPELDGVVFISVATPHEKSVRISTKRVQLQQRDRRPRQIEAATAVLASATNALGAQPQQHPPEGP